MTRRLILPILCVVAGCSVAEPKPSGSAELPRTVIANRESLDGKQVLLTGYLLLEDGAYQIYDGEKAYRKREYAKNCISLLVSQSNFDRFKMFSRSVVVLSGTLRKSITASGLIHLGGCNDIGLEVAEVRRVGP